MAGGVAGGDQKFDPEGFGFGFTQQHSIHTSICLSSKEDQNIIQILKNRTIDEANTNSCESELEVKLDFLCISDL